MQPTLLDFIQEIDNLEQRLKGLDHALAAYASTNSDVQAVPGIEATIATVFVARLPNIHMFKRARSFSARMGLTCREYSAGLYTLPSV
jgi:transposase